MRWKPENAVTIVTGATSGIGYSLTKLLVERQATVVATGRREQRLTELRRDLGPHVIPVVGDVTDSEVRERIVSTAQEARDGSVDLLVNNAGLGAIGPFVDSSPERLRRLMEVNFFAPAELTRLVIPRLRRGRAPVLCNVGSVLGHRAVPNKSEYCASKFALHGWSDALRAELANDGIQVTLISPSTTQSEFFDVLIETDLESSKRRNLGSWTPDRVARAILAAVRARRSEVICSAGGKLLVYADRLAPPVMNAILARSVRK